MSDNNTPTQNWLPDEVWASISSFLSPEEATAFALTCKFNAWFINNSQMVDNMLWQPLLNRLHAIDYTSVPPTKPINISAKQLFTNAFNKINEDQMEEINFIQAQTPQIPIADEQSIHQINHPAKTLKELERRHQMLENINHEIIQDEDIDRTVTNLDLTGCGLTRLPKAFLTAPENQQFFENIDYLDLSDNRLTMLPKELSTLPQLLSLMCAGNKFKTIPECIWQISSLGSLDFSDNELEEIPAAIAKLQALETLELDNNSINKLPPEMGKLQNLREIFISHNDLKQLCQEISELKLLELLHCRYNQLESLPLALTSCPLLNDLDCVQNNIIHLHKKFITQFGEDWYDQTINNKVNAKPIMLNAYHHKRRRKEIDRTYYYNCNETESDSEEKSYKKSPTKKKKNL